LAAATCQNTVLLAHYLRYFPWFTLKTAKGAMPNDDNTDKPGFNGPERRKKARRADKDRRDRMRWDQESPVRRKNPGRRARDGMFYLLDPKQ
jgi:hypothetical protein